MNVQGNANRRPPVPTKKLNSEDIEAACVGYIRTNNSDALWVSSLAIRAALTRKTPTEVKRALGLTQKKWPPRDVAFLPLHDSNHWSLLVVYRSQEFDRFYHYDSIPGQHAKHAKRVVRVLNYAGLIPNQELHIRITRITSFPIQRSNWECGWYLIRAVQVIVDRHNPHALTDPVLWGNDKAGIKKGSFSFVSP